MVGEFPRLGTVPQAVPAGERRVVSRRNAGPGIALRFSDLTLRARLLRVLFVAAVVALTVFGGAQRDADARTRLDVRVDALTTRDLLTRNPVALVDPVRQRRARAIADLRHAASTGWALAQILGFWWLWRSGTGARIRDVVRRRSGNRTAQRAVFGTVLGIIGPIASLPFAFVSYRVGFTAGITAEPLGQWFVTYAGRIVFDGLLGAVIVAVVLTLVEKLRLWYLIVAAAFYVLPVMAVALTPLLPIGPPQKTTPTVVAVSGAELAATVGVPGTPIVLLGTSHHSNAITARAAGIGPTARAVLGDVTLAHMTFPEIRVVLANALVHVRYADNLRETLFAVTLFVLSAAIAVLLSDRVGFRRDDDALSRLALVGTFLGLVLIFTYPIYNAYVRNEVTRTDRVALAADRDPASTVRAMVRYADDDLIPLCDRRSIRWYFDDRPALGGRIAGVAGTADPCPGSAAQPKR